MRVLLNGVDYSEFVRQETIEIDTALADTIPTAKLIMEDPGAQFGIDCLQEVVILNEPFSYSQTRNYLVNPNFASSANWTTANGIGAGCTVTFPSNTCTITITNGTNGQFTTVTQTLTRYTPVIAGQGYTLSANLNTSTPFSGGYTFLKIDFLDSTAAALTSATSAQYTNNNGIIYVTGTAPTGAAFAKASMGVGTTSGTNSGTAAYSTIQFEPQMFPDVQSYPTTACYTGQPNCIVLANGTSVREDRLFGGLITDLKRVYEDSSSNRLHEIDASGYAFLLAKTLANANYVSQTDYFIINDLVSTYLSALLTTRNVQTNSGVIFDQISWQDVPIKDALNTVVKSATGFDLWVDAFGDLHYQLSGTTQSAYKLSSMPDNVTSFPFYDFQIERNASEMSNRVKVFGGSDSQSVQPAVDETFSGNGSNKVFTLSNIPRAVESVTVGGTKKKVGVSGKDSFSAGYDALVNKPSMTVNFNVAPPNAANNVVVTYTAKSPVAIRQSDSQSIGIYGYTFDTKIEDSTLVTAGDTYQRGLIALYEYSTPRQFITLKTNARFTVGDTVAITSGPEGWTSKVFTIQKVNMTVLGTNQSGVMVYEYALQLGVYDPTFVHHLLHIHKKVKHTSSHVSSTAVEYALAFEPFNYSEAISATITTGGGGATIPLTLGGLYTKSATLSTAANMTSNVSSNGSVSGFTTHIGSATGWGEMRCSNGSGAWQSLGSAGSPSGNGFLWDVTDLEGHTLNSGNWTITLRFGGISKAIVADVLFRSYKRSSSGTYTVIGTASLAAQTFTSTYTTYAFSPQSMSSMAFVAGDKEYNDIWLNILSNPNGSTASLSIGAVATSAPADSKLSWITPGYV